MPCDCGCDDCGGTEARSLRGRPYNTFIRRRLPTNFPYRAPGQINTRVPLFGHGRMAYDAPRYGDTPARPPMAQVYAGVRPNEYQSEMRYMMFAYAPAPFAQYPRGRQTPHTERANIHLPNHVAYGSLFQYSAPPYGL